MAIRQRGTAWQADVTHQGKRHRHDFASEAEARAWERSAREAIRAGHPIPEVSTGTVAGTVRDLLDTIIQLDWSRKRGSQNSIRHAEKFVAFVGPALTPAEALTQSNVDRYLAKLIEQRKSGSTINRYLSAIAKMDRKAVATGAKPARVVLPWEREAEGRLRYFTDDEEALILQTLLLWGLDDVRDFFLVLVDTGGRTFGEVRDLPWCDVTERMVRFENTKNGKPRSVPLTERAWAAIQRQRKQPEGPFKALDARFVQRIWDRLRGHLPQLADTVLYTARHTFASRLVQRGTDLYTVRDLMGHKSIEQTMRYAHLAPKNLVDAIARLEPPKPTLRVVGGTA
jgi:integrase